MKRTEGRSSRGIRLGRGGGGVVIKGTHKIGGKIGFPWLRTPLCVCP